ncbi:protein FLX-like 2 isoform X2 [Andrographis paniculata]|uniref:protein FLX-like 2 isoform X2 n=1 Tax=Andrographis paniculata TaxID=175694 RepID=UPI0021E7A515|nr:protein FLX-like 2 isoform X2 [Andrographis paniculata]
MANKGWGPPPHPHHLRPLPGPGVGHPDPYISGIPPPHGGFHPPFEMLGPHEIMEQKLSAQHAEIEKLATENQRLAATHGTLRQDLATSNHELQMIHARIADTAAEKEQQMRGLADRMAMMESELKGLDAVRVELQQARAEAQKLAVSREELMSKAQQLSRDLHMAHTDAKQLPPLMAELDRLRQEYQHCRATYEYEKKLYSDHLESLQVMEKNYMAMSKEVEKLRAELTNFGPRTGAPYGGSAGYNDHYPLGNYASVQNSYGVGQGIGRPGGVPVAGVNSAYIPPQSAPYGFGTVHDASRVPGYSASNGPGYGLSGAGQVGSTYEPQRGPIGAVPDGHIGSAAPAYISHSGPGYDPQAGSTTSVHNFQMGPGYDSRKGPGYDGQSAPPYDTQRGSGEEAQRSAAHVHDGANFNASAAPGPEGHVSTKNSAYVSMPGTGAGTGYQPVP